LFLTIMRTVAALFAAVVAWFKTSAEVRLENLALRRQLGVLRRSAPKRLRLTKADRAFLAPLKRVWARWEQVLMIVKPETVLAWLAKVFARSGPGASAVASPAGRASRRKFEIRFE
jgi:hypothetical protein